MTDTAAYVARREQAAKESGHRSWLNPDGTFRVKSKSDPSKWRDVRCLDYVEPGGLVVLSCSCPAGVNRSQMPESCWHEARTAQRLRREGLAVQRGDGLTYWRDDVDLPESQRQPCRADCPVCEGEGIVCEEHPTVRWRDGDGCCGAPGMACPTAMPPMPPHPAERNWSGLPPRPEL